MLRYTWDNVKSSVRSRYFLLGIGLLIGVFFCSNGIGELCVQKQEVPLIIQEIFKYSTKQYERNITSYSAASMFTHGMGGFMYLVMPLAGLGFLLRFCDERYGGYDRMILARIGKKNYFSGTLLSSAILGVLTVMVSGMVILTVLYAALPSGAGMEGVPDIWDCIRQLGFACVLVVMGGWLGFLVAVITDSRFMAMVMPVLIFEVWTEICMGAKMGSSLFFLHLKNLFDPFQNGTPIGMYVGFMAVGLLVSGAGFYLIATKKMERGR